MEDISQQYLSAPIRAQQGERTISIDEMTGIQALERTLPSLPMRPGLVEQERQRAEGRRQKELLPMHDPSGDR